MDLNAMKISLGTKAWSYFLEYHSQGLWTPTYYLKQLIITNTLNYRLIRHSSGHVWLVEPTSLGLDG